MTEARATDLIVSTFRQSDRPPCKSCGSVLCEVDVLEASLVRAGGCPLTTVQSRQYREFGAAMRECYMRAQANNRDAL